MKYSNQINEEFYYHFTDLLAQCASCNQGMDCHFLISPHMTFRHDLILHNAQKEIQIQATPFRKLRNTTLKSFREESQAVVDWAPFLQNKN